jgi:hypothetical protein
MRIRYVKVEKEVRMRACAESTLLETKRLRSGRDAAIVK